MIDLITFLKEQMDRYKKIDGLARNVLNLSRNTLLVNLRFLDMALSQFELIPVDNAWATDGHYMMYDPRRILVLYQAEKETPVRDYLHMVMHCVFRHMYINTLVNQDYWNLACDIAAEASITDLQLKAVKARREEAELPELEKLKKKVGILTAEKLYSYFMSSPLPDKEIARLTAVFKADDHDLWYLLDMGIAEVTFSLTGADGEKTEVKVGQIVKMSGSGDGTGDGSEGETADGSGDGSGHGSQGESDANSQNGKGSAGNAKRLFDRSNASGWQDISERMQTDMETFGKRQGYGAGNMMQNLQAVNREKYDYTAFLKKFAVMGEAMKINDDEFDYIFYTYGLQLYKNVPLIEPLEYKDVKRIREFVIAIDTSGSTSGDLVQKFVQKTYNILKNEESFFTKINLHIIQCDTAIQEDIKITSQEEFDEYLKSMKLRGLGGTDFRPVFSYVDELVKNKEFRNLKGLIYFTDGYGTFPKKKPDYDTAFVFVDDGYNNLEVPNWAIKLVLQKDEV